MVLVEVVLMKDINKSIHNYINKNINIDARYENYGLDDCRLKNINDLYQMHEINIEKIEGFNSLFDIEQFVFKKFIVNFYNEWELKNRDDIKPLSIYRVQQADLLYTNDDEEPFVVGYELSRFVNGMYVLHEINIDEGYRSTELERYEPQSYLRFEYKKDNKNEWLHIVDEKTWY